MFRATIGSHPFACLVLAAAIGEEAIVREKTVANPSAPLIRRDADADQLKGTWDVVELIRGDTAAKILPNEDMKGTVTFEKDQFRFSIVPQMKDDRPRMAATFVLDATRTPAGIDLTFTEGPDKGKTARGIYKLNGEELIVRIPSREPFDARPEHFDNAEGSKTYLFTLKRAKNHDPLPQRPSVDQWLREEYRILPTSRIRSNPSK